KSGLRRAHNMYHGGAVRKKAASAAGGKNRKVSRQRFVKMPQKKTAPPSKMIAAGPFARTARPTKKPNKPAMSKIERRLGTRPSKTTAATSARVSVEEKSMSVEAACEKPIIPTLVGSSRSSHRAASAP